MNKFNDPKPDGAVGKKKRSIPSEIVLGMQNLADQDDADLARIVGVDADEDGNGNGNGDEIAEAGDTGAKRSENAP